MIHSKYGGSGASIWVPCNASIAMSDGMPFYTRDYDDIENDKPAALGNATHDVSEFCMKIGGTAYDLIGVPFNKSKNYPAGFVVDNEMAEAVMLYVGFLRSLEILYSKKCRIEQRVYMSSVRADVFGTSDGIFIFGDTLYIIDYKHGFVTVEVANNIQILFYAVAALDTFGLWDKIKHVKSTIVQPRADHIDGAIRHYDYTIAEVRSAQQNFKSAILNPNLIPQPGKHCKFCPASGYCRPRIMRTLQLAYSDTPLNQITLGETEIIFNEIDVIKKNLEKIQKRMLNHARIGNNVKGWKLVSALKHFVCTNEKAYVEEAVKSGVPRNKLYQEKLLSKSRVNKIVDEEVLDKYFIKPSSASTLVRMNDSRPALGKGSAIGIFKPVQ